MSEVFEGYERQYCEISASLSPKGAASSALDGEKKKQKLSEMQDDVQESESLIRKMDLEARSLQPSVKPGLLAKLREYKSNLSNVKSEIKKVSAPNAHKATREELLEAGMSDTLANSISSTFIKESDIASLFSHIVNNPHDEIKFFDFYGRKLNNWDVGISCNSARTFFLKSDKDFVNLDRPHLMAIQDPMVPDNDIGKNSFNYFKVKSEFSKAYLVLTDAKLITSLGPNRSILGAIVRPDSVLLDRKGWNTDGALADMLAEPWEPLTQRLDSENDAMYNWHALDDDEPLPRNIQPAPKDNSSSSLQTRKSSKSNKTSRKKAKAIIRVCL